MNITINQHKFAAKYLCPDCLILKDCDGGDNIFGEPIRRFFLPKTEYMSCPGCMNYQKAEK